MFIPIIGRSAAEFWLGPAAAAFSDYACNMQQSLISIPEQFEYCVNAEIAETLARCFWLSRPLETFSVEHNHHKNGKICHILTRYKPFPKQSFVQIKLRGCEFTIAVARPELCFLQAAKSMTLPQLVHLGMRICGQYYVQPEIRADQKRRNGLTTVQKNRNPITTGSQILTYLSTADGEYGVKRARQGARCLVDGANSPMEAALAAMMALPMADGGYGLPKFTMNQPLNLSGLAARHYGYDVLRGDFCWTKQKVVAEYNSKAFHMTADQQANDANRINAMQQSGYQVVPITFQNLKSFGAVENLMSFLMETLGCPEQKERLGETMERRKALCNEMLGTGGDSYTRFDPAFGSVSGFVSGSAFDSAVYLSRNAKMGS